MHPFALWPVDCQCLDRFWAGVADPVWCAGVELDHLAGGEQQVATAQDQA